MIATILLFLVYGSIFLLTLPLRLFSDVTMPGFLSGIISTANMYIGYGYNFLPVMINTLLATWGVFIVIETGIFLYKGLMWIIKKIPGIS